MHTDGLQILVQRFDSASGLQPPSRSSRLDGCFLRQRRFRRSPLPDGRENFLRRLLVAAPLATVRLEELEAGVPDDE